MELLHLYCDLICEFNFCIFYGVASLALGSKECICEYTYCIILELLPLKCFLKNAFVNMPTV